MTFCSCQILICLMHPNILLWSSFLIPIILSDDFSIEIKKSHTFIQQIHTTLIKSHSKDIYNVTKDFYFTYKHFI